MPRLGSLLIAIALVATACNADRGGADRGADGAGDAGQATELALVANDIAFKPTDLSAPSGTVAIEFDNQDEGISHNLHVTGGDVDEMTEIESGPTTQTLELELDAGTYIYVCDVHPQQMEGELTVE